MSEATDNVNLTWALYNDHSVYLIPRDITWHMDTLDIDGDK